MHLLISLALMLGFLLVLALGLLSVLRQLMERDFHSAPVMLTPVTSGQDLHANQRPPAAAPPGDAGSPEAERPALRLTGASR